MFNKRTLIDAALVAAIATLSAKLISTANHRDHLSKLLDKSNEEESNLWLDNMELKTQIKYRDIALEHGQGVDSLFKFIKKYD